MALKVPELDERKYESILEDTRKQIPIYTKDWTDHNIHDPGITFLELLVWLAEMQVYHLDQITGKHYLKFLKLMGFTPGHQCCASVDVTILPEYLFSWDEIPGNDSGKLIGVLKQKFGIDWVKTAEIEKIDNGNTIKLSTEINYLSLNLNQEKTEVIFKIDDGRTDKFIAKMENGKLNIYLPENIEGIIIPEGEQIIATDESGDKRIFETTETLTVSQAKITRVICDYPKGREDNTEANNKAGIYYLVFGKKAETDSCMYLGFDKSHSPFNSTVNNLNITIQYYEDNLPSPASHGDETEDISVSVKVVWQYCTKYNEWFSDGAWIDFELQEDSTLMLTQKGVIKLKRPKHWPEDPGNIFTDEEPYFWIRCKVVRDGYEIPPQIDAIMINTVHVLHKVTIQNEILERSDDLGLSKTVSTGLPNQIFYLSHSPVIHALIFVDEEKWTQVDDLDGSGPDDTHYIIERGEGRILFGDGIHGRIPPADSQVKADVYCYGGGTEGNIKSNSAWEFNNEKYSQLNTSIDNRFKAAGGTDEETYASALVRLKKDMKVPCRGITLEDYSYIATHTPGLRFGRAKALVRKDISKNDIVFHTIQVIIVPFSTKGKPEPSQGFIDTVLRHLNRHRLLTDKVEVKGPKYVGIGVKISVHIEPRYSKEGRQNKIIEALNDFLDPLKGGEDGNGWPFGRAVYRSEIYSLIENVEGVDCVQSVNLESAQKKVNDLGNIEVDEDTLVYSTSHQVSIIASEEKCRSGV